MTFRGANINATYVEAEIFLGSDRFAHEPHVNDTDHFEAVHALHVDCYLCGGTKTDHWKHSSQARREDVTGNDEQQFDTRNTRTRIKQNTKGSFSSFYGVNGLAVFCSLMKKGLRV